MPIRIICKKPPMWRGGVQHTEAFAEYPDGHFDDKTLDAIKADKVFFKVEEVAADPKPPKEKK